MTTEEACKHREQYGEGVEFPTSASLEHFDECFTPERRLEAYGWMRERSEVGTRCLMAGHVEERALAETATRLGYELGRKEALQEIANEMSTASPGQWADIRFPYVDVQIDKDTYRRLAAAREIGTKETG